MAGAAFSIEIENYKELNRALKKVDAEILKDLKKGIKEAAKPMQMDAQSRAQGTIRNVGGRWAQMRIGVTAKGAYMVPKAKRRQGSPRPNLAVLLYEQAMAPAFESHEHQILHDVELLLDQAIVKAGF